MRKRIIGLVNQRALRVRQLDPVHAGPYDGPDAARRAPASSVDESNLAIDDTSVLGDFTLSPERILVGQGIVELDLVGGHALTRHGPIHG